MWLISMAAGAAEPPGLGPFIGYLNLGVIVVVLYLAYTRKVRFEGEVKEKDERIAKQDATIEKYITHYQEEVLPALIDVTRVSGELVAYLNAHKN